MKKSTLFFKVMVLLALLVPWTGWGQIPDSFWNNSRNHLGTYVIELTEGEAMNVAYDLDNYNSLSLEGYNFDNATSVKGNLPSGITASIGDEENKDVITFSGTVGSGLNGKYEVKYYISYWNENENKSGYFTFIFQKWTEGDPKETVKIYVDATNAITKSEPAFEIDENHRLPINLDNFDGLIDWIFSKDKVDKDQPKLSLSNTNITWGIPGNNEGILSVVGKKGLVNTVPQDGIKVKIENGSEFGYILLTFERDRTNDWKEAKKDEITVYVNAKGEIVKYGETEATDKMASILISTFEELSGWTYDYVLEGTQATSQPILDPASDNQFSWNVLVENTKLIISGTDATIEDGETVKVKVKRNNEEGYLLVTFAKDETSEEPENPNEPEWATGDAQGTVTAYVNPEGQITRVEGDGTFTSGRLNIAPEEGWKFTIAEKTDDQPVFSDDILSKSFTWGVAGNRSLNVYGLDNNESVYGNLPKDIKVQIKNGDQLSYVLIKFVQDDDTWAQGDANATVTVYVDTKGKVVSTTPECSINEAGALTIDLDKVNEELAGWKYSPMATLEGDVTSDPTVAGDVSSLFSLMINGNGYLFVEKESTFDAEGLPTTVKVKIENGDKVGYLEINFKTITVIAEDDINKGGDDDNNNDQIDDDETTFVGDATGGKYVIYDGMSHGLGMLEITVDGETKVLKETDGAYDVVYGESVEEPVDAGTYSATITFNEAMGYSGTVTLTNSVVIAQRPITLYFSFKEGILEGEEFVLGENVFIDVKEGSFAEGEKAEFDELIEKGIISAEFALGETQSDGTVEVQLVSFNYPAGEVTGYDLKYSNYDAKLLTGHVKEHGEGGTETELPDAGEAGEGGTIDYPGESGSEIIVGDVDIIDEETGIGGSGINYRQYELKFCETDFFPNLNDYEAEGLKLFSRHNKFYTKANGSFTIWYEKDGVKNGEYGDYRIYISRNGADGDYSELKLDEVSDYFQIRNVNSDIWVRIYYGTGFPVANEEIAATDARAYAQANKIVVITPEPTDVQVISMAGAVVATDQVTGQREFANLAEGVYIVRMGETVIKLQVRN